MIKNPSTPDEESRLPDEISDVTDNLIEALDDSDLSEDREESTEKALVPFDPLQRYLAEIRRYPLLTREEEHRLAVEYKEFGTIDAAYKLVTSNLRLVVMIAREYMRAFRNLLDLIQEGNIGLMEALKKFDPYRGVRFPSYAAWWVRAYIIRYIMNNWRMVKIGTTQGQRRLFFNLQKEKEKLEAEGFSPAPKLLAQRLDVKEGEVVEMDQRLAHSDLSIDVPVGDGDRPNLLHFLADGRQTPEERLVEAEYQQVLQEKLERFAKELKDKELVIFRDRLLTEQPLTLREIGDKYGISRERVRQIEERVKKRLKSYLGRELKGVKDSLPDTA